MIGKLSLFEHMCTSTPSTATTEPLEYISAANYLIPPNQVLSEIYPTKISAVLRDVVPTKSPIIRQGSSLFGLLVESILYIKSQGHLSKSSRYRFVAGAFVHVSLPMG
ncbi:hypothetical protein CPB86DRAFT_290208 [Serendipita vermifera]|nr:hypothetical protein CPB86DRAFT_290208 [Serendipita vermifera]